ncbi:MAG: tRNA dihydrouridine synthase DusB [Oscillospiraceae bacterium]
MEYIYIGNVKIKKTAALAPMASVADYAYRYMCKKYKACYVTGEMASSKGLCYSDKKTAKLLTVTAAEQPMAVQLFGDDPDFMGKATLIAQQFSPQIIDVNMGCPVPKVAGNGSGSALMKNPELACKIITNMTKMTSIPITVKIRKGWDESSVNAVEFAKMLEQAGASAITVHGRTKTQMYRPPVDIDIIAKVKKAVSIPVIGNGDITCPQDAKEMYDKTGCDLVMLGRGSYGHPWIFEEIEYYLQTGNLLAPKTLDERLAIMTEHIKLLCDCEGESSGMRQARKLVAWYLKGVCGASSLRRESGNICTFEDLNSLIKKVINENS